MGREIDRLSHSRALSLERLIQILRVAHSDEP